MEFRKRAIKVLMVAGLAGACETPRETAPQYSQYLSQYARAPIPLASELGDQQSFVRYLQQWQASQAVAQSQAQPQYGQAQPQYGLSPEERGLYNAQAKLLKRQEEAIDDWEFERAMDKMGHFFDPLSKTFQNTEQTMYKAWDAFNTGNAALVNIYRVQLQGQMRQQEELEQWKRNATTVIPGKKP